MKRKILTTLALTYMFLILAVHNAVASTATWEPAVDTTYDLSFPGTILVYKDELNQGGLNLTENSLTADESETDIVFENDPSPDMAARGVMDLGNVNFDSVTNIPDDGYNTVVSAKPGHVYLVLTHDNNFAKVLVKSIIGQRVMLKYSLADEILSNPTNETGDQNGNDNGQTSYDNTTDEEVDITGEEVDIVDIIENPTNNDNNSGTDSEIDNSQGNQLPDNSQTPVASKDVSIVLQLNSLTATVQGSQKTLDVAPYTVNNRTLVPLRFIAEGLGSKVDWNPTNQSITVTLNNSIITLWINQKLANVNGKFVNLDVAPSIFKGRTMVPIRFISENFGMNVNYDAKTRQISVTTKSSSTSSNAGNNSDLSDLFGLFQLVVPGAVNEVPVGLNAVTYKANPGALSGAIAIYSDGTYIWNSSWDGKVITGKWERSGDSGYPITIIDGESGKDWMLGKSGSHVWGGGDIVIWDGSIWKNGTRVK